MTENPIPIFVQCGSCRTIFPSGFAAPPGKEGWSAICNCGSVCPRCKTIAEMNGFLQAGTFYQTTQELLRELDREPGHWVQNAERLLAVLKQAQATGDFSVLHDNELAAGLIERLAKDWAQNPTASLALLISVLSLIIGVASWRFPVSTGGLPPTVEQVIAEYNRQAASAAASPRRQVSEKVRAAAESASPFLSVQTNLPPSSLTRRPVTDEKGTEE